LRTAEAMKLAFSLLCENPCRQTALTTFFREYLYHSLNHFQDLEWVVFAGANQDIGLEHPRLRYIRQFPANDRMTERLIADHFRVGPLARKQGAAGLFTIGFVPVRARLPVFMGVNSLQHLNKDNRVGWLRQRYRYWNVARGVHHASIVIANSEFTAAQLRTAHPQCIPKLLVSHEGTLLEFTPVRAPGETEAVKAALGLEPGYLLWVSNFYHYKQAPLLLEGYADLPRELRGRMPLVMIGGDWDGGQAAAQAVINARGIQDNVKLLGWVDFKWLAPLYRHARAYVLASREETFGRTITEALSCGAPCVLHDIPIMHEISGGRALIIDFNQRHTVKQSLQRVFEDEALIGRLRREGLEQAKKFSFERMAVQRVGAALDWLSKHRG